MIYGTKMSWYRFRLYGYNRDSQEFILKDSDVNNFLNSDEYKNKDF